MFKAIARRTNKKRTLRNYKFAKSQTFKKESIGQSTNLT